MKKWRCTVCGYIHEGEEPPAKCPICGASREKFERMEEISEKQAPLKEQKQPVQTQYDVIVVGSGASALTAAITACHGGARVLILEKAVELGGTSKRSGGGMWVPLNSHQKKHGIEDNARYALQYMARCSYPNLYDESSDTLGLPKNKYDLLAAYVSNASPMIDFLREIGALKTMTGMSWKQKPQVDYAVGLPQNREIRGRTLFPMTNESKEGLGPELMGQLIAWAKKSSIDILTSCPVTNIIRDDLGRAVAVEARYYEEPTEFYAEKGIIFGSGGFSHNKEMMLHYQRGPHYGGCSVPENTGDLIAMAGKAGVKLGNMAGAFRAQSMFELALSTPGGSHNVFYIPGDSVLEVDKYGKRVLDEKQNYTDRTMLHFVWDPEKMEWKNMLLFMIFDKRTASLWAGFPPYPVPGQKASYIIEADSLNGIAAQIAERLEKHAKDTGGFRLDESFTQNLKESVTRFNGFAAKGFDEDFHRGETPYDTEWTTFPPTMPDGQWPPDGSWNVSMYPLSAEGPYYAIILGAGTLDTNGGPVVDNHAQMLDWDNAPVPGLYGAGNCIAAPSANAYWGAGGTLGPGMTFGYIAAMHALQD